MRIVIKLGTKLVVSQNNYSINNKILKELISILSNFHANGHNIVLVSSGAVLLGKNFIKKNQTNNDTCYKQMLSSLGQIKLIKKFNEFFNQHNIVISQILLTKDDFRYYTRYLNIKKIFKLLFDKKIIPIVNQNDIVADLLDNNEIDIGNNDILAALVSNIIEADLLILLTDQKGFYTSDPRYRKDAKLISEISTINKSLFDKAGNSSSGVGSGGMITKLQAAMISTSSGVKTIIVSGFKLKELSNVINNKKFIGTAFHPTNTNLTCHQRWIIAAPESGKVIIDDKTSKDIIKKHV